MSPNLFTHSRRRVAFCALALCIVGLAIAPVANAATAAAVDQYIPEPPGVSQGSGGGGGSNGGGANGLPGSVGTEAQPGGGGTLPFTGYPLTTLSMIVLALVAAGISVRLGMAGYERLRKANSAQPSA